MSFLRRGASLFVGASKLARDGAPADGGVRGAGGGRPCGGGADHQDQRRIESRCPSDVGAKHQRAPPGWSSPEPFCRRDGRPGEAAHAAAVPWSGTLVTMYSHMTGRTREQIVADFEGGDNYMSAEQALEYGLIDRIIGPTHD